MNYPTIYKNNINYGNLVAVELDGQTGYLEHWQTKQLGLEVKGPGSDDFRTALCLQVSQALHFAALIYFPQTSNIEAFAKAITKSGNCKAQVHASARILAFYEEGKLLGPKRKLSDFYTNITAQQDSDVAF